MSRSTMDFATLVELLRFRAQEQPDQLAYTFLIDGDEEGECYTYAQLDRRARAIGAQLQQLASAGERVLLLYPPGLEFLAAFCGCLYGGMIAIPAPPPDPARLKRSLPRLQSIVRDAGATVVLTTGGIVRFSEELGDRLPEFQRLHQLDSEAIPNQFAGEWQEPQLAGDSLAYLQYTSGSTASAKGVMIGHRNLMVNCAQNRQLWNYDGDSVAATWMPYFHDYGLVEGLIQPLFSGIPSYVMSPLAFLRRPLNWLHAISRYRVTHSAAPNFGYDHCVHRATPKSCEGLDLSSWRVASTGAEMVRINTLERFAETFEPYGFRRETFFPAYGLAEATLLVTTKAQADQPATRLRVQGRALERRWVVAAPPDGSQATSLTLVGCGRVGAGQQLAVVDPDTRRRVSADEVGEVWLAGPSVAQGYWQRPEETVATFRARIEGEGATGPFLRTGDLGFVRDGELYLVGRLKDVVIIRGCNHYPQDIEVTVEASHPLLRPNCCAAFSVEVDGEERLVIAAEVEREFHPQQLAEVSEAIRQAVIESHELQLYAVRLLRRGTMAKTSSGKIQRRACREAFLSGTLSVVGEHTENSPELRFPTGDTSAGPSQDFSTLVELLRLRARNLPDHVAYTFLVDGEREGDRITFGELDRRARSLAAQLQQLGPVGERALLVYPNGLDFVVALFGSLYAGFIAVPAPPPEGSRLHRTLPRLETIAHDARPAVVLTTVEILGMIDRFLSHSPALEAARWIATDAPGPDHAVQWREPKLLGSNLAVLQYTSGSTAHPRGVMVSHRKILRHSAFIAHGLSYDATSVELSWVPNFHDYGLMEGLLQPLYQGAHCVLMSPMDFIQRPSRWLRAISRWRATNSGGPNFAFELALRKTTAEERKELDLSCVRSLINAAEPVHPETMLAFYETFKDCGLAYQALFPSYGLAEATLVVSGKGPNPTGPIFTHLQVEALERQGRVVIAAAPGPGVRTFVGCGRPVLDTKVVIVDPDRRMRCAPDQVGEIWVSSPAVPRGYWQSPTATAETFQAYLADTGEGPFLRTGDLGFLYQGELHVAGRLKDMIIVRGQNYFPQDVEWTVEHCHENLRPGCSAAFSVEAGGEERLVVVAEVRRYQAEEGEPAPDLEAVLVAIRESVAETHGIEAFAVELLKPRELAKTSSGKIARRACRQAFLDGTAAVVARWSWAFEEVRRRSASTELMPEVALPDAAAPAQRDPAEVRRWLVERLAHRLGIAAGEIDVHQPFARYGLDSASAVSLSGELEDWLRTRLPATLLYQYATIDALSRHLGGEAPAVVVERPPVRVSEHEPIAIVGAGCRFPGASDPEAFWQLLRDGVDAISEVPAERWDLRELYSASLEPGKMTTRWGGFLADVASFDALFFSISPREAPRVDPQQRLLLEVAWEALEDAGLAADRLGGSDTGVFVGISLSDYGALQLAAGRDQLTPYAGTGSALSIAANRLSFCFDWHGPSVAVDTACSSSLVAVHYACQALRRGETSLALAGGVNVTLLPEWTIAFSQARMMASDGRCKTFDAAADGYVRGEGCGLVVLKRLSDAQRDGDRVLAVILGSAVNQDGRSNGLSAPNGLAQQQVVRQALLNARVAPAEVDYVEAHGTGTELGDPIEVQALGAALTLGRSPQQPFLLGSAKTNIGHLESAAGVAGLIKVALALEHQELPPHLHFHTPNPHIPWADLPCQVVTALRSWPAGERRRVAGVSSFGFGGTNSHVVLAEPPAVMPRTAEVSRPVELLCLSARSETALRALAGRYARWLEDHPEATLVDVCATANRGRAALPYRLAAVAASGAELQRQLAAFAAGSSDPEATAGLHSGGPAPQQPPQLAFLLSGQGSQYAGMSRELYRTQPEFRAALDRCAELLDPELDRPLLAVIFALGEGEGGAELLDHTAFTQPALFALEVALAAMWRSWGIEADVLLGHSVGEYAAAVLAEVLSLEDAAALIAARSRLMATLPAGGAMAAAFAPVEQVAEVVARHAAELAIAAVNGPASVTLSGSQEAVAAACAELAERGVETRPMAVSHAFHSPLIEPILDAFEGVARRLRYAPPRRLVISNLTGEPWSGETPPGPEYWRRHAREAVRFADGVRSVQQLGCRLFLELGPHPALSGMAQRCLGEGEGTFLASLRRQQGDWASVLRALGDLFLHGAEIDWDAFYHHDAPRRLALPTYPFERQRYWLQALPASLADTSVGRVTAAVAAAGGAPSAEEVAAAHARLELAPEDQVLSRYYQTLSQHSDYRGEEGELESYLHFAPLPEPLPEFSWPLVLVRPDQHPEETRMVQERDAEMRRVMFRGVDFARVERMIDFGCGYGTDLLDLAQQHPHLRLDGFTISAEQVAIGRRRAVRFGVAERVRFFHCDSTRDEFPQQYELMLGSQVLHHIREKEKVFANIARHLKPGGLLVLAEVLSNVEGAIDHAASSAHFVPRSEWAEQLADHGLRLVEMVDISREIGWFLDDRRFNENLELLAGDGDEVKRAHLEGPHHLGMMLRKGLALYGLLTVQRDPLLDRATLLRLNLDAFARPLSYPAALAALRGEAVAAPVLAAARAADLRAEVLALEPAARPARVADHLRSRVARVLELAPSQVAAGIALNQLGLDSLMALELKKAVEVELGVVVPVVRFLEGWGIEELAAEVCRQLAGADAAPAPAALAATSLGGLGAGAAEALAAQVDQLSDDQVEALLNQVLAQEPVQEDVQP